MSPDPPSHAATITDAYSLEVGAHDMAALTAAAPQIMRGSNMFIPYLPSQNDEARLAAAQRVRALGLSLIHI